VLEMKKDVSVARLFSCNIFIGVRIIKEMPDSVARGTNCSPVSYLFPYVSSGLHLPTEQFRISQTVFRKTWVPCGVSRTSREKCDDRKLNPTCDHKQLGSFARMQFVPYSAVCVLIHLVKKTSRKAA
jgi:hypothetical protein